MKIVAVYSKYITQNYYGFPVDHCTVTVKVSEELSVEEVEIVKEQAKRRLAEMPVESFPFTSAHGSFLKEYRARHPSY